MVSKRNISMWGSVFCLSFCLLTLSNAGAADTTLQVMTHIDEILKENPMRAGTNAQMIKIAETDTISLYVVRAIEGMVLKSHLHKTHEESVYVIQGTGQMFVNDKWVDIHQGTVHFNPMGKVHAIKHTGSGPLVVLSVFTPALKEPDRHFVE
jgi:mannose-6-phosphate isomerase-like protein (cupin superfamily)